MKHRYMSIGILVVSIIISTLLVSDRVLGQTPTSTTGDADIIYPVAELGNCGDKTSCRTYCDDASHLTACLAFAEKHKLMSSEELQMAKKFAKIGKGPGGCTTKESCNLYCDDISHINECVAFAEQNGLMSANELSEAKKVQAAIAKGVKPPACGGKDKCDRYCSDPTHMEECFAFGKAAGFMSEEEIKESEKVLTAIKKGVQPPACRGKAECDIYCRDAAHMEECMTFAAAAGFMNEQEAKDSQKMLQAIKKGAKLPACNGKDECEKYCNEKSHMEECIAFSVAAGFMNEKDAEMARKTGGKGPGGCTSKDACEAFCNNPANQETCFSFGRDNGMIPEGELKKMEEGKKQFSESLNQMSPETLNCISNAIGSDNLEKLKNGTMMPPRELGDKMGECFRQMKGIGGPGEGGFIPPQGQAGPGGCKTPEECKSYCTANPDACKNFGSFQGENRREEGGSGSSQGVPSGTMIPPGQSGPGGCKTAEECRTFCESNPQACANFRSGGDSQNIPNEIRGMMPGGPNGQIEQGGKREMMAPGGPGTMGLENGDAIQKFLEQMPGLPLNKENSLNPICPPGASCGSGQSAPQGFAPGTGPAEFMPQQGQQPMQQFQPPTNIPLPPPGSPTP